MDKMISNKLFQNLILPVIFLGLLTTGKYFIEQYMAFAHTQPSYYGQYSYGYNSAYSQYLYHSDSTYGSMRGGPYYQGGPYPMLSTSCNSAYGCRTSYDSQIYVRSALDYTYYKNPWLLEPRYMDNHQRYARGLWPQSFYY
jgi:hypothetical protein